MGLAFICWLQLPFICFTDGTTSYLDGSDEIAMEHPSSAPKPHQVSRMTCRLAGGSVGDAAFLPGLPLTRSEMLSAFSISAKQNIHIRSRTMLINHDFITNDTQWIHMSAPHIMADLGLLWLESLAHSSALRAPTEAHTQPKYTDRRFYYMLQNISRTVGL